MMMLNKFLLALECNTFDLGIALLRVTNVNYILAIYICHPKRLLTSKQPVERRLLNYVLNLHLVTSRVEPRRDKRVSEAKHLICLQQLRGFF